MEKRLRAAEVLPEADASRILLLPVGAEETEEEAMVEQMDEAEDPSI